MLRGLWQLTWLEIKIFVREPLGVIGTVAIPVASFILLGRLFGGRSMQLGGQEKAALVRVEMPVFVSILICLSAVLSLVTVIAIYRESGILKRLRATAAAAPHDPDGAGAGQAPVHADHDGPAAPGGEAVTTRCRVDVPVASFALALVVSTVRDLSIGLPDREPGPDGAVRAADRLADLLPDDRPVGTVRAGRRAAAVAAAGRASSAAHLNVHVVAQRDVARGVWSADWVDLRRCSSRSWSARRSPARCSDGNDVRQSFAARVVRYSFR